MNRSCDFNSQVCLPIDRLTKIVLTTVQNYASNIPIYVGEHLMQSIYACLTSC